MTPDEPTPVAASAEDPRVQQALERSEELTESSPAEHVEIYEDVHRTLQEVLADAAAPSEGNQDRGDADGLGDAGR